MNKISETLVWARAQESNGVCFTNYFYIIKKTNVIASDLRSLGRSIIMIIWQIPILRQGVYILQISLINPTLFVITDFQNYLTYRRNGISLTF